MGHDMMPKHSGDPMSAVAPTNDTRSSPDKLRELADRLLTGGDNYLPLRNRLYAHADAWETEQLEHASRIRGLDAAIEALRRRAEKHEVEFRWLLTHDSGDIGGVGRKRWLERKDALLAALAGEE